MESTNPNVAKTSESDLEEIRVRIGAIKDSIYRASCELNAVANRAFGESVHEEAQSVPAQVPNGKLEEINHLLRDMDCVVGQILSVHRRFYTLA